MAEVTPELPWDRDDLFTPVEIQQQLEASLKALRIDCLDLIQVHGFGCFEEDNVAAIDRKDGAAMGPEELFEG